VTLLANSLLDEHRRLTKPPLPREVARRVGEQIDKLLDDPEIAPDEVRAGLARMREKPRLGPGVLPSIVHEIRQEKAHPELAARTSPRRGHSPYQDPEDDSVYEEKL
jgi:hypothetical protein